MRKLFNLDIMVIYFEGINLRIKYNYLNLSLVYFNFISILQKQLGFLLMFIRFYIMTIILLNTKKVVHVRSGSIIF